MNLLAQMDSFEARRTLSRILDQPKELTGADFVEALDFNARLVTRCIERGVVYRRRRQENL